MVSTFALFSLLAGAAGATPGSELWLVRSLYPGQELLVGRTEEAIRELMPPELRASQLVGKSELERHMSGKVADLACLLGDARCAEPISSLLTAMGITRVVLVKGGQDDAGYAFKVATFTSSSPEVSTAESSGQSLGKALTGALVKVVPLAGTLEIVTDPPGMAVFVDGERVGQTPLSTQVLPGERNVRLEGPFFVPLQLKPVIPVRGRTTLRPQLEKTPARLTVTVTPVEAQIAVDGEVAGAGTLDRGISAGAHVVRVSLGDYDPQEVPVVAKPGETVTLNLKMSQGGLAALHKEAYGRGWDFIVMGDLQHVTSGTVGFVQPMAAPTRTGTFPDVPMQGIAAEVGNYDNFIGISLLGVQVARGTGTVDWTPDDGNPPIPMTLMRYQASAIQFRLRFHVWRLQAFAQAGVDFQMLIGRPIDTSLSEMKAYSVGASGRAALRAFPFQGLFVEAAYAARIHVPFPLGPMPLQHGLMGGVGYAF